MIVRTINLLEFGYCWTCLQLVSAMWARDACADESLRSVPFYVTFLR